MLKPFFFACSVLSIANTFFALPQSETSYGVTGWVGGLIWFAVASLLFAAGMQVRFWRVLGAVGLCFMTSMAIVVIPSEMPGQVGFACLVGLFAGVIWELLAKKFLKQ